MVDVISKILTIIVIIMVLALLIVPAVIKSDEKYEDFLRVFGGIYLIILGLLTIAIIIING